VTSGGPALASVTEADPSWFADPDLFRANIAEPCRPAIGRGVARDWPVVGAGTISPSATASYLRRFATDRKTQAFLGDAGIGGRYFYDEALEGFNFARVDMDLAEALDRLLAGIGEAQADSLYLGSIPIDPFLPGFTEENALGSIAAAVRPRIWIGNASRAACHYDTYDNVAVAVAGERRFTLYPPAATPDLYVGPIDLTMAGQAVALADGSEQGDPRYPDFETVRHLAVTAELSPGDALYIPKLWWHRVEADGPFNVLVNYWWDAFSVGPDAPYTAMLLAMIAIGERPADERSAWAALFDHYVFRSRGHPLRHLPERQHGMLGSLKDNYGRIRAHVMQMLRRA
jgi:hypothetical protein